MVITELPNNIYSDLHVEIYYVLNMAQSTEVEIKYKVTFQEMYINVGMANCEKRPKQERDDLRFTRSFFSLPSLH